MDDGEIEVGLAAVRVVGDGLFEVVAGGVALAVFEDDEAERVPCGGVGRIDFEARADFGGGVVEAALTEVGDAEEVVGEVVIELVGLGFAERFDGIVELILTELGDAEVIEGVDVLRFDGEDFAEVEFSVLEGTGFEVFLGGDGVGFEFRAEAGAVGGSCGFREGFGGRVRGCGGVVDEVEFLAVGAGHEFIDLSGSDDLALFAGEGDWGGHFVDGAEHFIGFDAEVLETVEDPVAGEFVHEVLAGAFAAGLLFELLEDDFAEDLIFCDGFLFGEGAGGAGVGEAFGGGVEPHG